VQCGGKYYKRWKTDVFGYHPPAIGLFGSPTRAAWASLEPVMHSKGNIMRGGKSDILV